MKAIGWLLLLILLPAACDRNPHRAEPLPHEAFVWQRVWAPEVRDAVKTAEVNKLHLLAAEMRWADGKPEIVTIQPDWPTLKSYQGTVGAVVRIHASAAKTGWPPEAVTKLRGLLHQTADRFQTSDIALEEMQLDYDCPESRLGEYSQLLRALQSEELPPLRITALPAWLARDEVRELLSLSPGYVLQVHSLHLPRMAGMFALMDEGETREAVRRAVEIGVPFRVALPTYSCVVVFDEKGAVKEVHGEDAPANLALAESKFAILDADAYALSSLAAEWRQSAPELLRALIWYRLPVASDRLNWPKETFEKVIRGVPLKRGWSVKLEAKEGGHHEVVLEQVGDAPDDLPREITLEWPGGLAEASDGLRGYIVENDAPGTLRLRLPNLVRFGRVPPKQTRIAGWVRLPSSAVTRATVKISR